MAQNTQVIAALDAIDKATNQLAAAQTVQTAKIDEIAADLDRLIAEGSLDPAVAARLQAATDGLQAIADFETKQAADLTAIASKSDQTV